ELARDLALERALGGHHEGVGVLVAPRRVLAVCLPVPGLEVDRARLRDEIAVVVVDPVPRERARPDELMLRRAVRADRECERRPGGRRLDADERPPAHPPRRGEPGTAAPSLDEADGVVLPLRVVA